MLHILLELIYVVFTYIRELLIFILHIVYYLITKWPSSGSVGKFKYFFFIALLYLIWVNIIVLFVLLSFVSVIVFFCQEEFKKSLLALSEVMLLLCIFYYLGAVTSFTYVNIVLLPSLIIHIIESDKPLLESIFIFVFNIVNNYHDKCSIIMDHFILEWTKNNKIVRNNKLHLLVWYVLYIILICISYYLCTCILFLTMSNIIIFYSTIIDFLDTFEQVFIIIIKQVSTFYTPGKYSILMFLMYIIYFFL